MYDIKITIALRNYVIVEERRAATSGTSHQLNS